MKATARQRQHRAFVARGRKAGKSMKQIGAEWRREHGTSASSGSGRKSRKAVASRNAPRGKKKSSRPRALRNAPRSTARAKARKRWKTASRNPLTIRKGEGGLAAAFKEAASTETAKTGLATLAGALVATGAPTLAGAHNTGWKGLLLTVGAGLLAGTAAAFVAPAYVGAVAAGAVVVIGLRTTAQFVPRAIHWAGPRAVAGFLPARTAPRAVAGYKPAGRAPVAVAGYLPAPAPAATAQRIQGMRREQFVRPRI